MSNNAYFHSFLKKNDKIYKNIQNNPLAQRDLIVNDYFPGKVKYAFTDAAGDNLFGRHDFRHNGVQYRMIPNRTFTLRSSQRG